MSWSLLRLLFLVSFILLMGLAGAALLIDDANRKRQRVGDRLAKMGPSAMPTNLLPAVRLPAKEAGFAERIAGLIGCDYPRRAYYPMPWWIVPLGAGVAGRLAAWMAAGMLGSLSWVALPVVWFLLCQAVFRNWNAKRRDLMLQQFPDALGMIVRTVRVGIPVLEGIRLASRECPDPTGAEFRLLVEEVSIGVPIDVALRMTAERVAMAEYRFFATAVSLQQQTGGGLSDALETLAEVVRKRLELKTRGFALTSEARTSALVLGFMPFGIGAMMDFVSPGYVDVLFQTQTGNNMLCIGALSLCIGVVVMRTLIRRTLE
jgi:tight adherence protein B